jgi:hypothetical protein
MDSTTRKTSSAHYCFEWLIPFSKHKLNVEACFDDVIDCSHSLLQAQVCTASLPLLSFVAVAIMTANNYWGLEMFEFQRPPTELELVGVNPDGSRSTDVILARHPPEVRFFLLSGTLQKKSFLNTWRRTASRGWKQRERVRY